MGNMIVSLGKKVIKQLTSIEYSLVFSRPYDGQVHVLSLEGVFMTTNLVIFVKENIF